MRVLFTVIPEKTMFQSMVALAWALRTAGHDVRVASQPTFVDVITQAGLTAVPVGRNVDLWRVVNADPELVAIARGGLHPPFDVVADPAAADWGRMRHAMTGAVRDAHKPHNFPMIASLVQFARWWRPDLVVWEPFTYAGAVAAEACGAVHGRLPWGLDVVGATRNRFRALRDEQPTAQRADPLADWLAGYATRYGFTPTEDLITGHFTVSQLPDSLQVPADRPYVRMRYVPYGGPATVPDWLWRRLDRPRVAVTLGTTATDVLGGYAVDVGGVLEALADLDVEVVVTVADAARARLGTLPANARTVGYVPLHALAPTCAAVIHHGGFGTLATFALQGVPQLILPRHFEGPLLARRLAAQGAGLARHADLASRRTVRESLRWLLDEPGFRDRAAALRDEFHAMPAPDQVAARLGEMCRRPTGAARH